MSNPPVLNGAAPVHQVEQGPQQESSVLRVGTYQSAHPGVGYNRRCKMPDDSNCLFHTFSQQMNKELTESEARKRRQEVGDYMRENADSIVLPYSLDSDGEILWESLRDNILGEQEKDVEAYVAMMAEVEEQRAGVNIYHHAGLAELAAWNHMGMGAVEVFTRNMSDHSLTRYCRLAAEGKPIEPLLRLEWAGHQEWANGYQAGTHWNIVLGPPPLSTEEEQPRPGDAVKFRDYAGCTLVRLLADGGARVKVPLAGGPYEVMAAAGTWTKPSSPKANTSPAANVETDFRKQALNVSLQPTPPVEGRTAGHTKHPTEPKVWCTYGTWCPADRFSVRRKTCEDHLICARQRAAAHRAQAAVTATAIKTHSAPTSPQHPAQSDIPLSPGLMLAEFGQALSEAAHVGDDAALHRLRAILVHKAKHMAFATKQGLRHFCVNKWNLSAQKSCPDQVVTRCTLAGALPASMRGDLHHKAAQWMVLEKDYSFTQATQMVNRQPCVHKGGFLMAEQLFDTAMWLLAYDELALRAIAPDAARAKPFSVTLHCGEDDVSDSANNNEAATVPAPGEETASLSAFRRLAHGLQFSIYSSHMCRSLTGTYHACRVLHTRPQGTTVLVKFRTGKVCSKLRSLVTPIILAHVHRQAENTKMPHTSRQEQGTVTQHRAAELLVSFAQGHSRPERSIEMGTVDTIPQSDGPGDRGPNVSSQNMHPARHRTQKRKRNGCQKATPEHGTLPELPAELLARLFADAFAGHGSFGRSFGKLMGLPVGFVEKEQLCRHLLATQWPGVPIAGDFYDEEWRSWDIAFFPVLVGGPSCQAHTTAGKRGRSGDPRSRQGVDMAAMAERFRPYIVVLENVVELLHDMQTMSDLTTAFDAAGYVLRADEILRHDHLGGCTIRDRCFLIFERKDFSALIPRVHSTPPAPVPHTTIRPHLQPNDQVSSHMFVQGELQQNPQLHLTPPTIGTLWHGGGKQAQDLVPGNLVVLDDHPSAKYRIMEIEDRVEDSGETVRWFELLLQNRDHPRRRWVHQSFIAYEPQDRSLLYSVDERSKSIRGFGEPMEMTTQLVLCPDGQIRALTAIECWSMMGVPMELYDTAVEAGASTADMYARAGNGICDVMTDFIAGVVIEMLRHYVAIVGPEVAISGDEWVPPDTQLPPSSRHSPHPDDGDRDATPAKRTRSTQRWRPDNSGTPRQLPMTVTTTATVVDMEAMPQPKLLVNLAGLCPWTHHISQSREWSVNQAHRLVGDSDAKRVYMLAHETQSGLHTSRLVAAPVATASSQPVQQGYWSTLKSLSSAAASVAAPAVAVCARMLLGQHPHSQLGKGTATTGKMAAKAVNAQTINEQADSCSWKDWRRSSMVMIAKFQQYLSSPVQGLEHAASDLAAWALAMNKQPATVIPDELLNNCKHMSDPRLATQPFCERCQPPMSDWMPLADPQPPTKCRPLQGLKSLLPSNRIADIVNWMNAQVRDLRHLQQSKGETKREGAYTLTITQDEVLNCPCGGKCFHGRVWDLRTSDLVDFEKPARSGLNADTVAQDLYAEFPDRELLSSLVLGCHMFLDTEEFRMVLNPHLLSLQDAERIPFVIDDLLKIKKKLQYSYEFEPAIPFFPCQFNPHGAVAKPNGEWRRVLDAGCPHSDRRDHAGTLIRSINEESKGISAEIAEELAQIKHTISTHESTDEEKEMLLDINREIRFIQDSRWPKELKITASELVGNYSVLAHMAWRLGKPVVMFSADAWKCFHQQVVRTAELHRNCALYPPFVPGHEHHSPNREGCTVVVEAGMPMGVFGASNYAQRVAFLVEYLFLEEMDYINDSMEHTRLSKPHSEWTAHERLLQQILEERRTMHAPHVGATRTQRLLRMRKTRHHKAPSCTQRQDRLGFLDSYTDDYTGGFVLLSFEYGARILHAFTQVTERIGLIMSDAKRQIGVSLTALGSDIHVDLGIVVIPQPKVGKAMTGLVKIDKGVITYSELRPLLGLLVHLSILTGGKKNLLYGMWEPLKYITQKNPAELVRITRLMRQQARRWYNLLCSTAGCLFSSLLDPVPRCRLTTFEVHIFSDAALEGARIPGLGGAMLGLWWTLPLRRAHTAVMKIPHLEKLAGCINVAMFHRFLWMPVREDYVTTKSLALIAHVDGLATPLVLTTDSSKSNVMQYIHLSFMSTQWYKDLSPLLEASHCFGPLNVLSDASSRGLWDVITKLGEQLNVSYRQVQVPPDISIALHNTYAYGRLIFEETEGLMGYPPAIWPTTHTHSRSDPAAITFDSTKGFPYEGPSPAADMGVHPEVEEPASSFEDTARALSPHVVRPVPLYPMDYSYLLCLDEDVASRVTESETSSGRHSALPAQDTSSSLFDTTAGDGYDSCQIWERHLTPLPLSAWSEEDTRVLLPSSAGAESGAQCSIGAHEQVFDQPIFRVEVPTKTQHPQSSASAGVVLPPHLLQSTGDTLSHKAVTAEPPVTAVASRGSKRRRVRHPPVSGCDCASRHTGDNDPSCLLLCPCAASKQYCRPGVCNCTNCQNYDGADTSLSRALHYHTILNEKDALARHRYDRAAVACQCKCNVSRAVRRCCSTKKCPCKSAGQVCTEQCECQFCVNSEAHRQQSLAEAHQRQSLPVRVYCRCKKGCSTGTSGRRCTCVKAGLQCASRCGCKGQCCSRLTDNIPQGRSENEDRRAHDRDSPDFVHLIRSAPSSEAGGSAQNTHLPLITEVCILEGTLDTSQHSSPREVQELSAWPAELHIDFGWQELKAHLETQSATTSPAPRSTSLLSSELTLQEQPTGTRVATDSPGQLGCLLELCCASPSPTPTRTTPPSLQPRVRGSRCGRRSPAPRVQRLQLDSQHMDDDTPTAALTAPSRCSPGGDPMVSWFELVKSSHDSIPQTDGAWDVDPTGAAHAQVDQAQNSASDDLGPPRVPSAEAATHSALAFDATKGFEGEGPRFLSPRNTPQSPPKSYSRNITPARPTSFLRAQMSRLGSRSVEAGSMGTRGRLWPPPGPRTLRKASEGLAVRHRALLRAMKARQHQVGGNRLDCLKLDLQPSTTMVDHLVVLMQQDTSPQAIRPDNWEPIRQQLAMAQAFRVRAANSRTVRRDKSAWDKYWVPYCARHRTSPWRTNPEVTVRTSARFLVEQAFWNSFLGWVWQTMLPRSRKDTVAKPSSAWQVLLSVRRCHRREALEHCLLPPSAHSDIIKGMTQVFVDTMGPEALLPRRKEPMPNAVTDAMLSIPDGTMLHGRVVDRRDHFWASIFAMMATKRVTGHRKGDVIPPQGEPHGLRHMARSNVVWWLGKKEYTAPTRAELELLYNATEVVYMSTLSPPCKNDQLGDKYGNHPTYHRLVRVSGNAAYNMLQYERRFPVPPQARRLVPLFGPSLGAVFSHSQLDTVLRHMLQWVAADQPMLLDAAHIDRYSWHSFRINLACCLKHLKAPDADIQRYCRWSSQASVDTYGRFDMPEYSDMMSRAAQVHFTGAQAATLRRSLPHIDDDHRYILFHELASIELPEDSDVAGSATLPDDVLEAADSTGHQGGICQGSSS